MRSAAETRADAGGTVSICSLRVGTGLFGIDTRQIREVLGTTAPQRVPLAPEYIAGVVPYRGDVLTTVSFRALLGLERMGRDELRAGLRRRGERGTLWTDRGWR